MVGHLCRGKLLASSQTMVGEGLVMANRAPRHPERRYGELAGWEPTETLFCEMMAHAGFKNPRLVSTSPHPGESAGNLCGNRSYFIADAGDTKRLPFVEGEFIGDPHLRWQSRA
jgi:hypothetical protein